MKNNKLNKLESILQSYQNESKTRNQIISDLHLFLEMLGDEIKSIKFPQFNSKVEIKKSDQEIIDSVDFNSALMISNSSPSIIIQSLLDAIILKHYKFFFLLCYMLFNSELDSETKKQVKDLYKSVKYEINYDYEIQDLQELYTLYLVSRKLLHISLSDWEEGRSSVSKIIEELFLMKELEASKKKPNIDWDGVNKFKKYLDEIFK